MKTFAWLLLAHIIMAIHMLKDKLLDLFFGWFWGEQKECPPLPSDADFLQKSCIELATMVRKQSITSEQLVEAYIARCEQVRFLRNNF